MVSKIFSVAAFAGMAMAAYTNGTNSTVGTSPVSTGNGTATTLPGSSSGTNNTAADESAFCAAFSGQANKGYELADIIYTIQCGQGCFGVEIIVDITINIGKRAVSAPAGLPDCINYCNLLTEDAANGAGDKCVATLFYSANDTCAFFSSVSAVYATNEADFALVASFDGTGDDSTGAGVAGSAVPLTTSVVPASTTTYTIYSCAATVTDCPYNQVATSVVAAYTTVCPGNAAASALAAPVACTDCPYTAKVVTVYSAVGSAGTTSYAAVNTQVINIASPTTNANGADTAGSTATAVPGGASATTSGVTAYTGAAVHVQAGMGMAAVLGAAALLI
jgi:hypothetical protein